MMSEFVTIHWFDSHLLHKGKYYFKATVIGTVTYDEP